MMEQIFKRFCCQKIETFFSQTNTTASVNICAVVSARSAFRRAGILAITAMLIFYGPTDPYEDDSLFLWHCKS